MIVGVTGGCGYIGSVLLPLICQWGPDVEALDIRPPHESVLALIPKGKLTFRPTDVTQLESLRPYVDKYDVIFHLAGMVGYPACSESPFLAHQLNVTSTENLMKLKRPEAKLLLASTPSVYGDQQRAVDELTPPAPNSIYGTTKRQAEEIVMADRKSIIYRFASAFGMSPVMRHDNMVHDFVSRAVMGEMISVYESHFYRQFIHVQDIAASLLFALTYWDKMEGQIFNVGTSNLEFTKRELVTLIARQIPAKYFLDESGNDAEKRHYRMNFKKLANLGFKPRLTIDEGIAELAEYYSTQWNGGIDPRLLSRRV